MTSNGDITKEKQFYESFLAFMKWGTIVSFGLGAIVVLLIAQGGHH